jgi:flagellar protein FlaF
MFTFVYIMMTLPGIVDKTISVTEASSTISKIEDSITKTTIGVNSISAGVGSQVITFTIGNSGTEKLWDYQKFSVIITYMGVSTKQTESLVYYGPCSGNPPSGYWCLDSISNDNLDPKILNTGETLNAKSTVSQNAQTGAIVVIVSADNGVTSSKTTTI